MNYPVILEKIDEPGMPAGSYYAHIPSLGLTTHGFGVDGAREAALDLLKLWIEEKRSCGESIPSPGEFFFSSLEVPDHALQST